MSTAHDQEHEITSQLDGQEELFEQNGFVYSDASPDQATAQEEEIRETPLTTAVAPDQKSALLAAENETGVSRPKHFPSTGKAIIGLGTAAAVLTAGIVLAPKVFGSSQKAGRTETSQTGEPKPNPSDTPSSTPSIQERDTADEALALSNTFVQEAISGDSTSSYNDFSDKDKANKYVDPGDWQMTVLQLTNNFNGKTPTLIDSGILPGTDENVGRNIKYSVTDSQGNPYTFTVLVINENGKYKVSTFNSVEDPLSSANANS